MNNNRLFDEHIKEQFSDYAPDVPPHIWENIIAKKERKKPLGFWFTLFSYRNIALIIGLLIAGGIGAWFVFKDPASSTPEKNITQSSSNKNNSIPANPMVTPENRSNSSSAGNNTITPATQTTPLAVKQNNVAANNTPLGYIIQGNTPATLPIPVSSDARTIENVKAGKIKKNRSKLVNISNKDNITTQDLGLDYDNIPVQGTLMGRLLFGIDAYSSAKKQTGEPKLRLSPFAYLPGCPTFEKDAAGNKKYLDFYAGPDFAMSSMSDTGNSAYLQKRKESAKVSSAYSAGIRYTKVFNNSMSLRVGVNYSQINEKFSFVQGNLVQVTYIIDANGDTTGSYVTTGTRYKTTHNKYRSIDVPLQVGYELGNGRLHANINAGVVVNLYSWQKGEVLDTAYQPVTITTGKGSSPYQFKTNAGLGFMGGVSVYYKLNDNIHLMAEPYYRHNFKQINKDNLTLKQKYNTVGLRLGVRIDLN